MRELERQPRVHCLTHTRTEAIYLLSICEQLRERQDTRFTEEFERDAKSLRELLSTHPNEVTWWVCDKTLVTLHDVLSDDRGLQRRVGYLPPPKE